MAKITRALQKIFASAASNNGQFGSFDVGTKVLTNDIATIQALTAYLTGWNSATVGSQNVPTVEEMQALQYMITSQLAYIFQEGISEYEVGTTYFTNSIVKKPNTYQIYGSVTDNNTGNALTDPTKWTQLIDLTSVVTGTTGTAAGQMTTFADTTGKALSKSTLSGMLKATGGVLAAAVSGNNDYVAYNAVTDFTVQQNMAGTTLTDGATVSWNMDIAQSTALTIAGNRTMAAPTSVRDKGTYVLRLQQDATGNRTMTWNSVFKWPGGVAPVLSTAGNAIDVLSFVGGPSGVLYGVLQKGFA